MNKQKSFELLTQGFKNELAQTIYESEKFVELMHEMCFKFVEDNIPLVNEDDRYDLALMMMETLNITTY